MALKWIQKKGLDLGKEITIPKHSYCSIPMITKLAGYDVNFEKINRLDRQIF